MNLFRHIFAMMLLLTISSTASAQTTEEDFEYWNPVMNALIYHESKGIATVRNGKYVGVLQISPGLVNACNNILKQRGESTRFTLNDRLNPEKSKQMFIVIMSKLNPERDFDRAIRIWAGGERYSIKGTQRIVNEIHAIMEKQEKQAKDAQ